MARVRHKKKKRMKKQDRSLVALRKRVRKLDEVKHYGTTVRVVPLRGIPGALTLK